MPGMSAAGPKAAPAFQRYAPSVKSGPAAISPIEAGRASGGRGLITGFSLAVYGQNGYAYPNAPPWIPVSAEARLAMGYLISRSAA